LKAYFLNENRSYEIKEKDEGLILESPYLDDFILYQGRVIKKESWLLNDMGLKELKRGNFLKAEGLFKKALLIEDSPYYHNNLGTAYLKLKKYTEALQEFKEALKLKPDYRRAKRNLKTVKKILGLK